MGPPEETDNALFEAIFIRALDVTGPLADELRRLGYDRARAVPRYPSSVFHACVEATRAQLYPSLTLAEGRRKIGGQFGRGFQQTIVGRVILGAVHLVGPAALLRRLPGRVMSMRSGLQCAVTELGPAHFEFQFQESFDMSDFYAGAMTFALTLAGAKDVHIVCTPRPGGYGLDITW